MNSSTNDEQDGSSANDQPEGTSTPVEIKSSSHGSGLFTRIREAAGTVYGDIGTSVLYCVMELTRETIKLNNHSLPAEQVAGMIATGGPNLVSPNEALGCLSLVFWALIFLTVKYDLLIMRADNRGEGGDFALWGLL
ncbi:MAG: KUP/HAK/KT family potassium transporter, partial [bacterium]